MKETLKWEMPETKIQQHEQIEIKLDGELVLCDNTKQFIDYLSDYIVSKNNKAMIKRNLYMSTLDVVYKLGLVFIVVKYFPEILGLFIDLRGLSE